MQWLVIFKDENGNECREVFPTITEAKRAATIKYYIFGWSVLDIRKPQREHTAERHSAKEARTI